MSSSIDLKDIKTPLIPQEIWVLEQYIQPLYCQSMVKAWQRMIETAEAAYDDHMRHIPSDYRRRELGEQVDVVWGNRVLPNFRKTYSALQLKSERIAHGDYGMLIGGGIRSDIRGSSDYWHGWMEEPALIARLGFNPLQEFYRQQKIAMHYASNIEDTFSSGWSRGALTGDLDEEGFGWGLTLPQEWPTYRLNTIYQCATGEPVPKHGIYLPAAANSCAQFMPVVSWNPDALDATIGVSRGGGYDHLEPTIWTLVERVSDTGGGKVMVRIIPEAEKSAVTIAPPLSALPGAPCPKTGLWFAPHLDGKKLRLTEGEPMPGPEVHPQTRNGVIWYFQGE